MPDLALVNAGDNALLLRTAELADVPRIVELLAADQRGTDRDSVRNAGDLSAYESAFTAIDRDPHHLLVVGVLDGELVATFQLSFLPGLARRGAWRAQIEGVRVDSSLRGRGLGSSMLEWAAAEARSRGCSHVQLTTDRSRVDAKRFYERLGFVASHEGMKMQLARGDQTVRR